VPTTPVNPFFAVEPPLDAAPTAGWVVEPVGAFALRLPERLDAVPWRRPERLTPIHSAGLAPVKRTFQC